MATIIKKPSTTTVDAATNAVQQINNNRALTVTSKRVPAPSENVKRSSALTNSISPINLASNPQLKSNSPIPVAITRSPNAMQMIPTIVKAADPPSISVIPRTVSAGAINEQRPKTFMAKTSSVLIEKIPPKPITKSPTVHAPEQSNTAKRPRPTVNPAQIKKHSLSLSRRPAINVSTSRFNWKKRKKRINRVKLVIFHGFLVFVHRTLVRLEYRSRVPWQIFARFHGRANKLLLMVSI